MRVITTPKDAEVALFELIMESDQREAVGQIITLAMDAASAIKHPHRTAEELKTNYEWRHLVTRLKGNPT